MAIEQCSSHGRSITRGPTWLPRVSQLRHDLHNILGEITGFADVLLEEAREQKLQNLLPGLEKIRQSAHRILAEVNHTLNPDSPRLNSEVLDRLADTVLKLSGVILTFSQELSDQCDDSGQSAIGDDLLRISGSARRLKEASSTRFDNLIDSDSVTEVVPLSSDSAASPEEGNGKISAVVPMGRVDLTGTVLVVDDQESNRALLARRLRKQGHRVSLAENGRQALERLRHRRFDLVLLDIIMPEMDGMEVLRELKADPKLQNIPVLMLSALDALDAVVRCIELGAEDYLPKPFPAAILQARIQVCLANKRMSDQLRKYTEWLFGKTLFTQAVAAPGSLDLHRQERTILFADIRGFTRWTEGHTPEETVAMLNQYFEAAERIWANSSVIKTEYTGDEIMGVFPNPFEAVRIGHTLRIELGRLLQGLGLGIGIGLHTGLVTEGIMGGTEVKAYCFVGDTVNSANRICEHALAGQVLLSETTCIQLGSRVTAGPPFELSAKGKTEPLKVRPLIDLSSLPEEAAEELPQG